ncbi:hypothetical protein [Pontivivens ytuae]|uniref:Uncharacterized protein n=1 Tax=Pontivivens ytuae TaxID=2789856 RepID=A0A7S9QBE2_9RHOB|nr:hypothetical protein [Pontivivens ytuae]QPH52793.1 hypothetical protein I0K15_13350 [Pontivivens ytuae]
MSALDWLLVAYGASILALIGRGVEAILSNDGWLRPAFWAATALGLALFIEFATPASASFGAVMLALIDVAAQVF